MLGDALRDAEGSNRFATLVLGWIGMRAGWLQALSIADAEPALEPALEPDNPAVLAALGLLALDEQLDAWLARAAADQPTRGPNATDANDAGRARLMR